MSNELKIGDRVKHKFLGEGTVVEVPDGDLLAIVKLDKAPDIEYNLGVNPTAELIMELEIL